MDRPRGQKLRLQPLPVQHGSRGQTVQSGPWRLHQRHSTNGHVPLGLLDCKFGNSLCSFFPSADERVRCYQEGTLAHPRDTTCYYSHLVNYLKTSHATADSPPSLSSRYYCICEDSASCVTLVGCPGLISPSKKVPTDEPDQEKKDPGLRFFLQ